MFKRTVPLILVTMVLLNLVSTMNLGVSAEYRSGSCGDNLTWDLDTSTGVLNITGYGSMENYGWTSYMPWYAFRSYIKTVNIEDSVTSIGNWAFYQCYSIENISFPDSLTYIGEDAFAYCSSLKAINIPESVKTIGDNAFSGCSCLSKITLPDSPVNIGDYVFGETSYFNNKSNRSNGVLYIGKHLIDADNSTVDCYVKEGTLTIVYGAFSNCTSLVSVNIPDSVLLIGSNAFRNCKSLKSASIGNSVTSLGSVFYGCTALTDVTIGNSVQTISGTFAGCSSLASIVIPDCVTTIGWSTFENCTALRSVTIPDSVTWIGNLAFHFYANSAYYKLTMVTIRCYKDSYAYTYASNNGFKCEIMCKQHSFTDYIPDNNPGCETDETITAICNNGCDTKDVLIIENTKLGHSFINYVSDNNATCTDNGTKTAKCERCYKTDTVTDTDSMLGHTFTYYVSDENATCTEAGTKTAKCDRCDVTDKKEEGAKGHIAGEWETAIEATKDSQGEKVKKCINCSVILETEIIEKLFEFPDVPRQGQWYSQGVYYCVSNGYITGTDKGTFNPNDKLTREQFVVILARVANAELEKYTISKFTDVKNGDWYAASVIWANEEGYVYGVGDGSKFGVGQNMTREQLAAIFFRYAEKNGEDILSKSNVEEYDDAELVSSWSADACAWAIDAGLLGSTETSKKLLAPRMPVTRAQAAKIFMSYDAFRG
ncbi:MAG: leucine-rich repeat protein [Clostridia bacterium]|nr:leucine-rich repeat protein [Clostridia bacterium]